MKRKIEYTLNVEGEKADMDQRVMACVRLLNAQKKASTSLLQAVANFVETASTAQIKMIEKYLGL